MMEPVAYAAFEPNGHIRIWSTDPGKVESYDITPLVRLSDAEARIKELEAALDHDPDGSGLWRYWASKSSEIAQKLVEQIDQTIAAEARAEAAEALLKEAGKALSDVAEIYSNMETGDGEPCPVVAAARAIHHKIGVKDENR